MPTFSRKKSGVIELVAPVSRVLIRADASSEIGSGHVMRCLTLADALRDNGTEVSFVCSTEPGNYINFIQSQGFAVVSVENATADLPVEVASSENPVDWLVVDHYELDAEWEIRARQVAHRLMVIDDLADRTHDCDLLLDQNFLPSMATRYVGLVSDQCRTLLGPSHTLLRKEFLSVTPRHRDGSIHRILMFFGGADPHGLTQKAVDTLGEMNLKAAVGVVIGLAHRGKEAIEADCHKHGFSLHVQTDRMASLLDAADLIVGGGGTSTWERCKLGVPSITVIVADNQREVTEAVAAEGATVNLGDSEDFTPERLRTAIENLMNYPEAVRAMSEHALALMHSERSGTASVIDAIENIE